MWGYGLLQTKDPDGAIALVDTLLHQLAELILNNSLSDLSAEKFTTIETLLLTVFDIYWQSEMKVKDAFAEFIGDKYIPCLSRLHEVLLNFPGEDRGYSIAISFIQDFFSLGVGRECRCACGKGVSLVHLLTYLMARFNLDITH